MTQDVFVTDVRIRGTDLDREAKVSAATFLRYFENMRWDAHAAGASALQGLFSGGRAAVVVAQRLRIFGEARFGMKLRGEMWLSRVGRTSLGIEHLLTTEQGEPVAQCGTTAVHLGVNRRPEPVPDAIRSLVRTDRETVDLPAPPEEAPADANVLPHRVRASEIDFLQHVNQANYLSHLDDARRTHGSQERLRTAHIVYEREALESDALQLCTWWLEDGVVGGVVRRGDEVLCRARLEL